MIQREFSGKADFQAMAALVRDFSADNLHVADLPYRFSSWAFDYPDNVGLWGDDEGQLLAWAVMQTPFWTIDYAFHPGADGNLHRQVLDWADGRARCILDAPSGRPAWFVNVFADQMDRIRDLEETRFASQADVGDDAWSKVLMQHSAEAPPLSCNLPAGFIIRPLEGEGEVEAYVELHRAVFESRNMTAAWRACTLRQPAYMPDLDLVAVAPGGRLAAFCVCWLNEKPGTETLGQIEPLGVHADFRKLGLGRAVLAEGLRRLQLNGASRICVETDKYRNAALELYESVGFRIMRDVLVYRKDYV